MRVITPTPLTCATVETVTLKTEIPGSDQQCMNSYDMGLKGKGCGFIWKSPSVLLNMSRNRFILTTLRPLEFLSAHNATGLLIGHPPLSSVPCGRMVDTKQQTWTAPNWSRSFWTIPKMLWSSMPVHSRTHSVFRVRDTRIDLCVVCFSVLKHLFLLRYDTNEQEVWH